MARAAPQTDNRRGRPKGTGINDRALLGQLTSMLKKNSNLNPTAAIRSVGITDVSAIRRLRDKLKLTRTAGPAEKKSRGVISKKPSKQKPLVIAGSAAHSKAAPLLKNRQSFPGPLLNAKRKRSDNPAPKPGKPPAPDNQPQQTTPLGDQAKTPNEPHAAPGTNRHNVDALKLTLESAVAMARLQRQLFDQAITNTPLGLIYKSQAMFAEFIATAMLSHQALFRKIPRDESK